MKYLILLLTLTFSLLAAEFPAAGVVSNSETERLDGVTVTLEGTGDTTLTDSLGGFGDYLGSAIISSQNVQSLKPTVTENTLSFQTTAAMKALPITLIDSRGRVLMHKEVQATAGVNKVNLPLSEFAHGVYLIRIGSKALKVQLGPGGTITTNGEKSMPLPSQRAAGDSLRFHKHGYKDEVIPVQPQLTNCTLEHEDHSNCEMTYDLSTGSSWHFVGQSKYVNTYRGLYWVGPSKSICKADVHLNYTGDISDYTYKVTVWTVDPANNLELLEQIATSDTVSGSEVVSGGSWVPFTFPEPVTITSGKTCVLISRADTSQYDIYNILRVNNTYDEDDEENCQFNVHYSGKNLAGRKPGDEDQPEPFAFHIKLYGEEQFVFAAEQFPAAPMNISGVANGDATVTLSWEDMNVAVTGNSYRVYYYNMTTAETTFIAEVTEESFTSDAIWTPDPQHYVVTSVSPEGNESHHTDIVTISHN